MISRDKKAELLLLLITIIWGSTFVITKSSLDHASPLVFLGIDLRGGGPRAHGQ